MEATIKIGKLKVLLTATQAFLGPDKVSSHIVVAVDAETGEYLAWTKVYLGVTAWNALASAKRDFRVGGKSAE